MSVYLTKAAITRIKELMISEGAVALRLSIEGGGCSGFSYKFSLPKERQAQDEVFEEEGACLLVDKVSLPYLLGATLDFKDSLIEQSFIVDNPNASSSCGCGVSFSI